MEIDIRDNPEETPVPAAPTNASDLDEEVEAAPVRVKRKYRRRTAPPISEETRRKMTEAMREAHARKEAAGLPWKGTNKKKGKVLKTGRTMSEAAMIGWAKRKGKKVEEDGFVPTPNDFEEQLARQRAMDIETIWTRWSRLGSHDREALRRVLP